MEYAWHNHGLQYQVNMKSASWSQIDCSWKVQVTLRVDTLLFLFFYPRSALILSSYCLHQLRHYTRAKYYYKTVGCGEVIIQLLFLEVVFDSSKECQQYSINLLLFQNFSELQFFKTTLGDQAM